MTCRACGSGRLSLVFEMDPMPLAGAFALTREDALAATRYTLEWRRCRDCGLVNVAPSIPEETIFGDYSYRASDVPALVRHHAAFAEWLVKRFPRTRRMLEVGGNDGVLLRNLPTSWSKVNVDPSDVAVAHQGDWSLAHTAWPVTGWSQGFDLITSSNAFGHFDALGPALAAVHEALRDDGYFVMEVHDLAATLAQGQWDTIYHEHRAEWSLPALSAAGATHGLRLEGHERLPLHGGLLRAIFVKDVARTPSAPPAPDFRGLVAKYRDRRPTGATVAYGAAARASVYLNQVPEPVDFVVDASPRRYGRFVPGTGAPIVPPERFDWWAAGFSQDAVERGAMPRTLITAWTQADDIKAAHPRYPGEWVTAW